MLDRYVVIGQPVDHSRSPDIHARFAEQTGERMHYDRLAAPVDQFAAHAREFFADGGAGANVTLPFKTQATELADTLGDEAQRAGAVNTLTRRADGRLVGDNTDGIGLIRDLRDNAGIDPDGRDILILGAGGAVRGILGPLCAARPGRITIVNRTEAKARAIVDAANDPGVRALPWDAIDGRYDIVINSISSGLSGTMPSLPDNIIDAGTAAYDMLYADGPTPFVSWAADRGAATCRDGFGMLVEQAAAAFHIWRGVRPDTAPVIRALRP